MHPSLVTPLRPLVAALAVGTVVLAGCSAQTLREVPEVEATSTEDVSDTAAAGEAPGGDRTDPFEGRLVVEDQAVEDRTVVIEHANVWVPRGWVVVYDDEDGDPGRPLGWAQVVANQGDEPLEVTLPEPVEPGTTLWAVLHVDADPVGVFEPGNDIVLTRDGGTLRESFTVDGEDA